jgi:hypothetical protein
MQSQGAYQKEVEITEKEVTLMPLKRGRATSQGI